MVAGMRKACSGCAVRTSGGSDLGRTVLPTSGPLDRYGWSVAKNDKLREFLRSRRARVQPEDVEIETGGQRRVPGLRREEVAMLAGVSLDYYARLEQGRDLQPSDLVLDAIARALRLAEVERTYLHNLVRSTVAVPKRDDQELKPLDAGMRLMLDSLEIPALIIDLRGNVDAMNRMGRAMFVGLEPMPSAAASHPRWLFLEPPTRDLFIDWEMIARSTVAVLREAAGRYPRDKALHALIGELSVASPEFRSWWAEHDVRVRCRGLKRFHHPVVGELVMQTETLQLQDGDRWLYAYAVEPGSRSAEALRLLGTWAATQDAEEAAAGLAHQARPRPRMSMAAPDGSVKTRTFVRWALARVTRGCSSKVVSCRAGLPGSPSAASSTSTPSSRSPSLSPSAVRKRGLIGASRSSRGSWRRTQSSGAAVAIR